MAKILLWIFIVIHFLNLVQMTINKEESSWEHVGPMWIAIAVLAICESIEKRKELK